MLRNLIIVLLTSSLLVGCVEAPPPASGGGPGLDRQTEPTGPTCEDGCDDGDPCTEDACVESACEHVGIAGCTIHACNGLGLMDVEDLVALEDGAPWKIAGRALPEGDPTGCTEADCQEACCNTCDVAMGLQVDGQPLHPVTTDRDIAWSCVADDCAEVHDCEPLLLGSSYWIWGKVDLSDEAPHYIAQGWCRPTTVEALPGQYLGTWVSDVGEAHTIELTIGHLGAWSISVQGIRECEACTFSIPSQIATGVFVGDGEIDFVVAVCTDGEVCDPSARRDVLVTLSSHEDRLIGTFQEANSFAGISAPYAGAVGLERQQLQRISR